MKSDLIFLIGGYNPYFTFYSAPNVYGPQRSFIFAHMLR